MINRWLFCLCLLASRGTSLLRNAFEADSDTTDEIAFKRLLALESLAKENADIILTSALPYLRTFVAEAQISERCSEATRIFIRDFKELNLWTIQMLDATAKPEAGILRGTMGHLGDYEQCLNVEGPTIEDSKETIKGKYCLLDTRLPLPPKPKHVRLFEPIFDRFNASFQSESLNILEKRLLFLNYYTPFRWAICLPSQCSKDDIKIVLRKGAKASGLKAQLISCEVKETIKADNWQLSVAIVLGVFVATNLVGTLFDSMPPFEESHSSNPYIEMFRQLSAAFSVRRNFVRGFEIKSTKNATLDFIYGLRYLSMWWVFLVHAYVLVEKHAFKNIHNIEAHRSSVPFLIVENGYLAVETFLFLAAVLMSYKAVKDHQNRKRYQPIRAFICRVWRLLPSVTLTVGVAVIFPLFSSGPLWKAYSGTIYANCRASWWTNILFINNFVQFGNICVITTWYLAVDVQCYLLGVVYIIFYIKKPMIGYVFNFLLLASSILSSGILTFLNDYAPVNLHGNLVWSDVKVGNEFMTRVYSSPHVHLSVYALGLFTGTIMATKKLQFSQRTLWIGWALSIVSVLLVTTASYPWLSGNSYSSAASAAYAALYRTGWASSLAWLTLVCFFGHGGIVNYVLSFSIFKPLGQITFMAYLLHYFVIYFYIGSTVIPIAYNHVSTVYYFFGLATISHIVGFIGHIFVEAPMSQVGGIALNLWSEIRKEASRAENGTDQGDKTATENKNLDSRENT